MTENLSNVKTSVDFLFCYKIINYYLYFSLLYLVFIAKELCPKRFGSSPLKSVTLLKRSTFKEMS